MATRKRDALQKRLDDLGRQLLQARPYNLLVMNEGTLKGDTNPLKAFERTMGHPDLQRIVIEGEKPIMKLRLTCMNLLKSKGTSYYAAASRNGESRLDPAEEFQVEDWLQDLEQKRREVGAAAWLP